MSVNSKMKAIADAIRAKTGGTAALTLDGMAEAVAGIEAGGGGGGFPNGTEWTQSNIAQSYGNDCQGLLHSDDGNWFVVYQNKQVYCSTDGMTWVRKATISGITTTRDSCYAPGLYVLATNAGVWYSSDCVTWTQSDLTSNTYRVVYSHGVFVAHVLNSGLWYSTDGATWTQSNAVSSSMIYDVYCNSDGVWVATGGASFCSKDGKEWTSIPVYNGIAVAYGNGLWVIVTSSAAVQTSTDGMTWTRVSVSDGNFYNVGYAEGMWVASGRGLWYSTDGATWIKSGAPTGKQVMPKCNPVFKANGVWVAEIEGSGLFYSTDGMTWTQSNFASTNTNYVATHICHGNGVWVASGDGIGVKYSPTWLPSN